MSFCKTRFHCWVSANGNGAHTGEGTCRYRCYRRPAVEWNEVHRQSVFVAASMHTIEWRNNYEERTTLVYIVVCGCQTRRSPYETKHAGWTFCFTAELPKVKTPCVTNTPQGVKPFFLNAVEHVIGGWISSLTHSQVLRLNSSSLSRCLSNGPLLFWESSDEVSARLWLFKVIWTVVSPSLPSWFIRILHKSSLYQPSLHSFLYNLCCLCSAV